MEINKVKIKGFSFNPYTVAYPTYERFAGIVPFHFYNFNTVKKYVEGKIENISNIYDIQKNQSSIFAFFNNIEVNSQN